MSKLISSFFQIIGLIRFSLMLLVLGVAVLWVDQWLEALRYLTMEGANEKWQSFSLGAATLIASLSTWYSAHVMFMLCIPHIDVTHPDQCPRIKKYLPKILGLLMNLLVMIAIMKANEWSGSTWVSAAMLFQYLALFFYTVIILFRKKVLSEEHRRDVLGEINGFRQLPSMTLKIVGLALLVNFFMMILVTISPWSIAWAGTAAIVLIAVGLMAPVGSLLTYFGSALKFPVLTLIFIWIALVSLINDNHLVRLHAGMSSTSVSMAELTENDQAKTLPDFDSYLTQWIAQRKNGDQPVPLIIVSAEGGGIRAAYWTATVLAALEDDKNSDFGRYVFAISGVSGGSLGGALYTSMLKNKTRSGDLQSGYSDPIKSVLSEDFLSPTAATMLFPDLLQRFLPFPVFNDRAITLEKSWERAWGSEFNQEIKYFDLYGQNTDTPLLFLNSTVVETGRRLILSPLNYSDDKTGKNIGGSFNDVFNEAINAQPIVGRHIPLSTAVHLSARFTYVSPAGKVYCDDFSSENDLYCGYPEKLKTIRLVDGGYFENSATVTSSEILNAVKKYNAKDKCNNKCVEPLLLHISNQPVIKPSHEDEEISNQYVLLNEILSPVRALLHVRPARGFQSRKVLENENKSNFYHIYIKQRDVKLPLGWMLSELARAEMNEQLNDLLTQKCGANNSVCDLLKKL